MAAYNVAQSGTGLGIASCKTGSQKVSNESTILNGGNTPGVTTNSVSLISALAPKVKYGLVYDGSDADTANSVTVFQAEPSGSKYKGFQLGVMDTIYGAPLTGLVGGADVSKNSARLANSQKYSPTVNAWATGWDYLTHAPQTTTGEIYGATTGTFAATNAVNLDREANCTRLVPGSLVILESPAIAPTGKTYTRRTG